MFDFQDLLLGIPVVLAMLLALSACVLMVVCYRSMTVGLIMVSALFMIETLIPGLPSVSLGIQLYLPDFVTLFLGGAGVLRLLFARPRPKILPTWYVFLAVISVSFVFGFSGYGVTAGTAVRTYFYAVAVASYFMTFPVEPANVNRLLSTLAWLGATMLIVVLARWVVVLVPIGALLPPGGRFASSEASQLRVIASEQAIVLAQVLVVLLFFGLSTGTTRRLRVLLPLIFIAVLILQHRSVWLAALAGIFARFMLPAQGRRPVGQLLALMLATLVIALPVALSGRLNAEGAQIAQSADRAVGMTDTSQARLETWKFILDSWRAGGLRTIVLGQPFGTPMDRVLTTRTGDQVRASFSAHNYYLQTLFNTGLVGVGASVSVFLWLLVRLYRLIGDAQYTPTASPLFLLLLTQLAYYVPYGIHYLQFVVVGVAAAYVRTARGTTVMAGASWQSAGRQASQPFPLRPRGAPATTQVVSGRKS